MEVELGGDSPAVTDAAAPCISSTPCPPPSHNKGGKTAGKQPGSGCAQIKAEFIDHNHKPRLAEEYLPQDVVDDFHKNHMPGQDSGARGGEEPPSKKAKLKGRNKKRPFDQRTPQDSKLCSNIVHGRECRFGDSCRFSHDVQTYLNSKQLELDGECYAYKTYGVCQYGITCVFAKSHLTDDLKNKIDEEVCARWKGIDPVVNSIGRELQFQLRRKKYNFKKANSISSGFEKQVKAQQKKNDNGEALINKTESCQLEPEVGNAGNVTEGGTASTVDNIITDPKAPDAELLEAKTASKLLPCEPSVESEGSSKPLSDNMADSDVEIKLRPAEHKKIDFSDKLYLAPLTTVGNLPFRRVCKRLGADVTCGEMALTANLLQGQNSEWALLKRHESEDLFGVQLCGSYADTMTRCAQVITEHAQVDFIDINCGCPIDLVFKKGEGSALMARTGRFEQIVRSMTKVMGGIPLTVKIRTGIYSDRNIAHTLVPRLRDWGVSMVTVHGRSREQRYTRLADWDYINTCCQAAQPMPVFGNGDILSYEDYVEQRKRTSVAGAMIARGALIKPWIFTEIKEERHWDIRSSERLELLREFCNYGMTAWGSDAQGVATTRRFLLEWLSFLHRYIPVGVLERLPQKINQKPPYYFGRDDLETLMASANCGDWVKISEMLLGPVPAGFIFLPKHKANAYQ